MRLLVDTNVLIALARRELSRMEAQLAAAVSAHDNVLFASATSFWAIAINTRLGKIDPASPSTISPIICRRLD
jgi:PIN domain nuclease of toxin-antitoxin system